MNEAHKLSENEENCGKIVQTSCGRRVEEGEVVEWKIEKKIQTRNLLVNFNS